MKRLTFSALRSALAAMLSLGTAAGFSPLERLYAGRLMHSTGAEFGIKPMSPGEWLQRTMIAGNDAFVTGFERAGKPTRNVGYVRRQGPNEQRIVRPNYAKQNRRVARALAKFNGDAYDPTALSTYHAPRAAAKGTRDSLTGIVS
jgi:hypothetical protein